MEILLNVCIAKVAAIRHFATLTRVAYQSVAVLADQVSPTAWRIDTPLDGFAEYYAADTTFISFRHDVRKK